MLFGKEILSTAELVFNWNTAPLKQSPTPLDQIPFTELSISNSKAFFLPINVPQSQIHVRTQALHWVQLKGPSEVRGIGPWSRKAKAPACHGTPARWIVWVPSTHFGKHIFTVRGSYFAAVSHGGKWIFKDVLELGFRNASSTIRNSTEKSIKISHLH